MILIDLDRFKRINDQIGHEVGGTPFEGIGDLTASFGVATLGPDDDRRTLLCRADLALYTAKSEGRDRVVAITGVTDARDVDPSTEANGRHG